MTETIERVTSPIVAALEVAWHAIRGHHPELPARVAFVTGEGAGKWGHFAPRRWVAKDGAGEPLHEILVSGERFKDGAEGVLSTMLHEATHTIAHVREIKDTSRGGRYHNARFKSLAESLTLCIEQAPRIGWSVTSITDATRERYGAALAALDEALTLHRDEVLLAEAAPRKSSNNGQALTCGCVEPRKLRASNKVVEEGPIVCGLCGEEFLAREVDEDEEVGA